MYRERGREWGEGERKIEEREFKTDKIKCAYEAKKR